MDTTTQIFDAIRDYENQRKTRRVFPTQATLDQLTTLPQALPATGLPPEQILNFMIETVAPATVLTTSGRYFGFVTGGVLPAAQAANMLATAWDQNTSLTLMSPAGTNIEQVALNWLAQLLHIPSTAAGTFVTGATMASFTGMAAARHALLKAKNYDVESQGLFGAPEFPVVVSEESHSTLFKALALLGLGRDRVLKVPTDAQGRMDPTQFPTLNQPALICLQAGNVNSGAMDPAHQLIPLARQSKSWVHVDGAFGLWGAGNQYAEADSWATDGHKWLNVPYDSGIAFVRDPQALTGAMAISASYFNSAGGIEPMHKSPEASRRARGFDAWAAILSLGENGVREMIDRCCQHARTFATTLSQNGIHILNEIHLNQVMAALDTDEKTLAWIEAIQNEGICWAGSTAWHGRRAMRISVSSWATTGEDVELSLQSMLRCRPR